MEKKVRTVKMARRGRPIEIEMPKPEPGKMPSIWRIYATNEGRERALTHFQKLGYKYFVLWQDVAGLGLEAAFRAAWQDEQSAVHIDR